MKKTIAGVAMLVLGLGLVLVCGCSSTAKCASGDFQCLDNTAYACGSDSKWAVSQYCIADQNTRCVLSKVSAKCEDLVPPDGGTGQCNVGDFACSTDETKAYNCNTSSQWTITDCAATAGTKCELFLSGARCSPLYGVDGGTAQCGSGGFKCVENIFAYTCGTDLKWQIQDCGQLEGNLCAFGNKGAGCQPL